MARRIRQRRRRTTTAVTRYGWEGQQSSQVLGDSGWGSGSVGQSAGGGMAVANFSFLYNWVSLCSEAVMESLPFF